MPSRSSQRQHTEGGSSNSPNIPTPTTSPIPSSDNVNAPVSIFNAMVRYNLLYTIILLLLFVFPIFFTCSYYYENKSLKEKIKDLDFSLSQLRDKLAFCMNFHHEDFISRTSEEA